ncbi:zinc finger protein [Macleaya cordata]|uniref:Replication protein A subunit n=1 Tax=Macleaya cordata TaxID=56857 RepID=A0A200R6T5_MACCD|nr:zinc finger protein [Macleaya cordata]
MAVNLTNNAIAMICNGEFQGDDAKPVVQVADIKLLSAGQQNGTERYRMLLSDGMHLQQGMLATQMNSLVHSGKLQKGSVVQLSQFVSQVIQNRKIIIIIELNVILEKCDPIGVPKQYVQGAGGPAPQARTSMEQPGMAINPQSYAGASVPSGPSLGQSVNGAPLHQVKSDPGLNPQSYGSSIPSNPNTGGFVPTSGRPVYPKAEPGTRLPGSAPLAGNYGDQNRNLNNLRTEGGPQGSSNSYSRPLQPTYQQPPPMYMNRGPIAKNEAPARVIPIAALNPYQGRWTIKARVTSKKDLRRYNNARGEGKVFSFDLLDSDGGEIQVTCFNAVADQFYDQIEAGKVYLISRGMLKPASKNFNRLQNEYEIYLENTSTVQPCMEDDNTIPRQQFHFRPISDIEIMESNAIVDVIGVVSSINLTTSIMKKDGTETLKRTLQLKDMSGRSVELTLWGNVCTAEGQQLQNMCDSGVFPVLAVKAGRVNEFNGRSVGTLSTSQLFIEPDFPEARRLKEWFDMEGKNTPAISISRDSAGMGRAEVRKTVSQIKDERLGTSEKPDWITIKGTISFIKVDNFCYTACPLMVGDRQCNKKVTNNGDGQWRCDRCDQYVGECDYRYILQFQIQDFTGVTWVTAFQEIGEEIMGISAKELYYLKYEEQDDEKFMDITRRVLFTRYIFKLKVKEETFSDEQRVKSTVVKAEKLNFSSESRFLLDLMDKLAVEDPSAVLVKAESGIDSGMNSNFGYQNMGNMRHATPALNSMESRSNAGRDFGVPANQMGQHGNPYSGANSSVMAGTGVYLCCSSCGGTGHNSKNCPSVMNRQGQSIGGGYVNRVQSGGGGGGGGASGDCYKCHQSGHWARDCPGSNATVAGGAGGGVGGGGGGASGECWKCHQSGHWARDCPGTNSVSSMYGGSSVTGRYGGVSNQRVGGF